jgi:hypothetical protein
MASSGMLHYVALVRTNVSEELSVSVTRVTRIGKLGTLAVTSNRHTQRNIPEDGILHSHRHIYIYIYIYVCVCVIIYICYLNYLFPEFKIDST